MSTLSHTVFVYGTLQRDHVNHRVLHRGRCELVGRGVTLPEYLLFNGGFPKMATLPRNISAETLNALSKLTGHVAGEAWRVDDESLMECDRLEGHPHFYQREKISIKLDDSPRPITAWTYIIVEFPFHNMASLLTPKKGVLTWNHAVSRLPDTADIPMNGPQFRGRILKRESRK